MNVEKINENVKQGKAALKSAVAANWPGPKVLIVDDDLTDQSVIEKAFEAQGIIAVSVPEVGMAHRIINDMDPDFIILDIDGVPCFREIVNGHRSKTVVFSGSVTADDVFGGVMNAFNKTDIREMVSFVKKIALG